MKTILALLAALALVSGCTNTPRPPSPPSAIATAGTVTISQTGNAATPATANVSTGEASFVLPKGTEITFSEKLGTFAATLPADSSVKLTTRNETATAPQAFTPPLPPSPAENAAGWRVKTYTWAALACIVLAALFAWRAHWLAAICAGIAAAACHLLSSPAGLYAAGSLLAVAATFVIAWHLTSRPSKTAPAT